MWCENCTLSQCFVFVCPVLSPCCGCSKRRDKVTDGGVKKREYSNYSSQFESSDMLQQPRKPVPMKSQALLMIACILYSLKLSCVCVSCIVQLLLWVTEECIWSQSQWGSLSEQRAWRGSLTRTGPARQPSSELIFWCVNLLDAFITTVICVCVCVCARKPMYS